MRTYLILGLERLGGVIWDHCRSLVVYVRRCHGRTLHRDQNLSKAWYALFFGILLPGSNRNICSNASRSSPLPAFWVGLRIRGPPQLLRARTRVTRSCCWTPHKTGQRGCVVQAKVTRDTGGIHRLIRYMYARGSNRTSCFHIYPRPRTSGDLTIPRESETCICVQLHDGSAQLWRYETIDTRYPITAVDARYPTPFR
jgi:hypothetical protein